MENRLHKILAELSARNLDAFLVTKDANVSYLSGFIMGDAILLIMPGKGNLLITDSRFIQEVSAIKNFKGEITSTGIPAYLRARFKEFNLRRVAFESDALTHHQFLLLKDACSDTELIPIHGLIEELRTIKDDSEIKLIKEATKISLDAFNALKAKINPGMTEKMIADCLESLIREHGAYKAGFDIIVASGVNSSRPHARPTGHIWQKDELLLIDWGACYDGYNCDLTRTLFSDRIDAEKKRIYRILLEAQEKAFLAIRPGVKAKEIDLLVRNFLKENKLDKLFLHSLGHGIGRDVHELPNISARSEAELKENMVFVIEPAVYFNGEFGIRLEDLVVVTKNGCEVLSKT